MGYTDGVPTMTGEVDLFRRQRPTKMINIDLDIVNNDINNNSK